MSFVLRILPPSKELETKAVLKACVSAHGSLSELKGEFICNPIFIGFLLKKAPNQEKVLKNLT